MASVDYFKNDVCGYFPMFPGEPHVFAVRAVVEYRNLIMAWPLRNAAQPYVQFFPVAVVVLQKKKIPCSSQRISPMD